MPDYHIFRNSTSIPFMVGLSPLFTKCKIGYTFGMITLATVLLILSAICFALGAAGVGIDWTNAGFTFIVLWLIVGGN